MVKEKQTELEYGDSTYLRDISELFTGLHGVEYTTATRLMFSSYVQLAVRRSSTQ
jgi:hypothetical protein